LKVINTVKMLATTKEKQLPTMCFAKWGQTNKSLSDCKAKHQLLLGRSALISPLRKAPTLVASATYRSSNEPTIQ